jgi:hypothetical protein
MSRGGLTTHQLEVRREMALADLLEAREEDFANQRVNQSAKTANALSRFLLLEELVAAAPSPSD